MSATPNQRKGWKTTRPSRDINSRELYFRLLGYVRPYWKAFAVSIVCMVLSSVLEPAFPALMKYLLDDGFSQQVGAWDWVIYPAVILVIFVARAIIGFVADYAMAWVSRNLIHELRLAMFAQMIRLPVSYYVDHASGRLMSRIAYDVNGIAAASTSALTVLVKDSVAVVALLAWLIYLNWKLTLITFALVPFIALAVRLFSHRIRQVTRGIQAAQGEITQVLQESIEGHKVVKVFGGEDYEKRRFNHVVSEFKGLSMRAMVANAALGPIVQFFAAIAVAVVMGIALRQSFLGETTVGEFVSFVTAMLMTLAPLKRLTDINSSIQRGLAAAESIFHVIDQTPEPDSGTEDLGRAIGQVEFDGVTFTYPGSEQPVLHGLSFSIRPGECVALIGPSGSGKSTVANLLPRFYQVDAGEIRIDGHPIDAIKLESLRRNIALVSQEIVLFNDTIAANIAYGSSRKVDREEIVAAARAAHALEFIERLPEGFDSLVGERGVKLSGGQRQRLAIARAILKNAPILVLDEATSALDTESERQVQAALDELMAGRSTLVIAHRLSTIEGADRIIALSHGQKVEEGTHAGLLAADGLYAKLYRMQKAEESVRESN